MSTISEDGDLKDAEAPEAHFQGQVGCSGRQVSALISFPQTPAITQS